MPAGFLADRTEAVLGDLKALDPSIGPDSLLCLARLAETRALPAPDRDRVAAVVRSLGRAMLNRDPAKWHTYVAKPLKLAPLASSTLAADLAEDVARNLDWEIRHQDADGSWAPYWTWGDAYPDVWPLAEREWRGVLTLENLRSLKDSGRIEGLPPSART